MSEDNGLRWRKTDESVDLYNFPQHNEHTLIYGRIYTTGMSYDYSETNQLIRNFKIKPSEININRNRIYYKKQAIEKFSEEAIELFSSNNSKEGGIKLVPIPPSKTSSHPDFDNRIDKVSINISEVVSHTMYFPLLRKNKDMNAFHESGETRNPSEILDTLNFDANTASKYDGTSPLVLMDDVLTSGAHFSACRQKILSKWPKANILGVFWAKAESPFDFDELGFDDLML